MLQCLLLWVLWVAVYPIWPAAGLTLQQHRMTAGSGPAAILNCLVAGPAAGLFIC